MESGSPLPQEVLSTEQGRVWVATRAQIQDSAQWRHTLSDQRKDYRYHEIVEETILQGFDYRYFVLEEPRGRVRAIQPFFMLNQDLVQGAGAKVQRLVHGVRR